MAMLGTLSPDHKRNWKGHIQAMVHAYNCTHLDATRFSPYYLMFGHALSLPVDVAFGLFPQPFNAALTSWYVQELQCHLKSAHNLSNSGTSITMIAEHLCHLWTLVTLYCFATCNIEHSTRFRTIGPWILMRLWRGLMIPCQSIVSIQFLVAPPRYFTTTCYFHWGLPTLMPVLRGRGPRMVILVQWWLSSHQIIPPVTRLALALHQVASSVYLLAYL